MAKPVINSVPPVPPKASGVPNKPESASKGTTNKSSPGLLGTIYNTPASSSKSIVCGADPKDNVSAAVNWPG